MAHRLALLVALLGIVLGTPLAGTAEPAAAPVPEIGELVDAFRAARRADDRDALDRVDVDLVRYLDHAIANARDRSLAERRELVTVRRHWTALTGKSDPDDLDRKESILFRLEVLAVADAGSAPRAIG